MQHPRGVTAQIEIKDANVVLRALGAGSLVRPATPPLFLLAPTEMTLLTCKAAPLLLAQLPRFAHTWRSALHGASGSKGHDHGLP